MLVADGREVNRCTSVAAMPHVRGYSWPKLRCQLVAGHVKLGNAPEYGIFEDHEAWGHGAEFDCVLYTWKDDERVAGS